MKKTAPIASSLTPATSRRGRLRPLFHRCGYEPEIISSYLEEKSLTPEAILLTHCHFDHVGAVKDLAAQYDCKVFLDKKELAMPPMLTNGPLYYTDGYGDGDTLTLAGIPIQVLETPGHTPGSVTTPCSPGIPCLPVPAGGRTCPVGIPGPCGILCAAWQPFPKTTGSAPATVPAPR